MSLMFKAVAWLSLVCGVCGAVFCLWVFIDPSILAPTQNASSFAPPSPRWRAALGLLMSVAMAVFGACYRIDRKQP